jgi:hypothetical protein
MTVDLSPRQLRNLRLRSQRLHPGTGQPISSVPELVKTMLGLQAQEPPSGMLAVRPRTHHLVAEDVRRAREEERSIVLTWCMRGTMHLVSAEDLAWMLPLFGPLFIRKGQRRYKQLGLDPETRSRAAREIRATLNRHGPLTRPELARFLAEKDIPVAGQAIAHLVRYAALEGVICFGPERDGKLTYVVLEDWLHLPETLDPDQVQIELAHRYLEAYGPATPYDLASWSGLPVSQARSAFQSIPDDLIEVKIGDSSAWMLPGHAGWLDQPSADPIVRLLPGYDAYLLGYQNRDFMVPARYARRIHPGGGLIKPTLIVDGLAVGIWKKETRKDHIAIIVEPFETLNPNWLPGLEAEIQDLNHFLNQKTTLKILPPT